jgi:hypothetical protein
MPLLYLHVGLMKTGTTFLQSLCKDNAADLAEQGIYYPAGPDAPSQRHAVWDLVGRRAKGARDDRITGQWKALTDSVARAAEPTVLLSEEYLASANVRLARRVVAGFPDREVHVLVTARDLGRVLASAWQEDVKNDTTRTWAQYIAAIRDPGTRGQDPARSFWMRHDLPAIIDTWASVVGAERVHIVTVPPAGAPRDLLLQRIASVVGFDPSRLTSQPRPNESLGAPATEVLRRVNERLGHRLNERQYDKVIKVTLQRGLTRRPGTQQLQLAPADLAWATTVAERTVAHLEHGFHLVGALEELLPVAGDGRRPDEFSTEEMLEASLDALALVAEDYASTWWRLRRSDSPKVAATSRAVRVSSALRSVGFEARRRGAQLADRSPLAATAMRGYLRLRAAERRRPVRGQKPAGNDTNGEE